MTDYTQIVSFAPKDSLTTGNPAKLIKGAEIDPELAAISAAVASKLNSADLATEVGTQAITINTTLPTASTPGFRGLPPNSQSVSYTAAMSDMGKHIIHPSGGGSADVYTIPSNTAVAFPVGATLTFVNLDTNAITVAIQTDTMIFAGSVLTGTRTIGPNGIMTALKVGTTTWLAMPGPAVT